MAKSYAHEGPEAMENMFQACLQLAKTSPEYISKTKADSKGKRRPRPTPRPNRASDAETDGELLQLAQDDTETEIEKQTKELAEKMALESCSEDEPHWVGRPGPSQPGIGSNTGAPAKIIQGLATCVEDPL